MNEYNEAIQRLETQERVPSLPLHRTYFPIPRKDTPRNYDFVFRTTGNTNIPKYSIPMNCVISNVKYDKENQEFIPREETARFKIELDPTFVTTQGYRKSIAVRKILFPDTFSYGQTTYRTPARWVASSINPWSQKNIIGELAETFQAMPRLFPWNGEKYIDIWFLNMNGEIVQSPIIRGYIELELIIDNENTYAIDE